MALTDRPRPLRVLTQREVQCPAGLTVGEADGGSGCHCRITNDLLTSTEDPTILDDHCFNPDGFTGYATCLAWRRDKEHGWRHKTNKSMFTREGENRYADDLDRQHAIDREYSEAFKDGLDTVHVEELG